MSHAKERMISLKSGKIWIKYLRLLGKMYDVSFDRGLTEIEQQVSGSSSNLSFHFCQLPLELFSCKILSNMKVWLNPKWTELLFDQDSPFLAKWKIVKSIPDGICSAGDCPDCPDRGHVRVCYPGVWGWVVLAVVVHHDTLACLRLTQVSAVLRVGVEPQLRSNISIEEVVIPQRSSHSVVVNRL